MAGKLEAETSVLDAITSIPAFKSASFVASAGSSIAVNVDFSVRDTRTNATRSFSKSFMGASAVGPFFESPFPSESPADVLASSVSPSGSKSIVFKAIKDKEEVQIEHWTRGSLVRVLNSTDKHGKVYNDGWFSSFSWSPCERYLMYVAESNPQKTSAFWDALPSAAAAGSSSSAPANGRGEQYDYKEEWGEGYAGKRMSRLFILDLQSPPSYAASSKDNAAIVEVPNIPSDMPVGMSIFTPSMDGVVFVGYDISKRRLGIKYCFQRKNSLYFVPLNLSTLFSLPPPIAAPVAASPSVPLVDLSPDQWSVRFPRFSPNGGHHLVFFAVDKVGMHNTCSRLCRIDWVKEKDAEHKTVHIVIDTKDSVAADRGSEVEDRTNQELKEENFPGLFVDSCIANCWASSNKHILVDTVFRSSKVVLKIDIESGAFSIVSPKNVSEGSCSVLDVRGDLALISRSSPIAPASLSIVNLVDKKSGCIYDCMSHVSDQVRTILSNLRWSFFATPASSHRDVSQIMSDGILVYPVGAEKPLPVIDMLHGGPHSAYTTDFFHQHVFYCALGYAILMSNYRGSIGQGMDSIRALPSLIGSMDVKDCVDVSNYALQNPLLDSNRVFACGGSHGGFLAGHLIGQYPTMFKAAVMRNPVTNISSMMGITDIPDWCQVECGVDPFVSPAPLNADVISAMFKASPMAYIDQVKTPTAIFLGKLDKRVPPSQGMHFYYALKDRGVTTRLVHYPDNEHAIIKPAHECDMWLNTVLFIQQHDPAAVASL